MLLEVVVVFQSTKNLPVSSSLTCFFSSACHHSNLSYNIEHIFCISLAASPRRSRVSASDGSVVFWLSLSTREDWQLAAEGRECLLLFPASDSFSDTALRVRLSAALELLEASDACTVYHIHIITNVRHWYRAQ